MVVVVEEVVVEEVVVVVEELQAGVMSADFYPQSTPVTNNDSMPIVRKQVRLILVAGFLFLFL